MKIDKRNILIIVNKVCCILLDILIYLLLILNVFTSNESFMISLIGCVSFLTYMLILSPLMWDRHKFYKKGNINE